MKYDPAFATSPICVTDRDYEFSVDLEIITFAIVTTTIILLCY